AGAPQKKLDVPLSSPADRAKAPVQPAEKPDEADPDAPEGGGGEPKNAAPAPVIPSSPSNSPAPAPASPPATERATPTAGSNAVVPARPGSGSPAKETTAPATPAEEQRNGVAKPPPEIE
ncbi:MAG TPA: hypothetical protein VK684_12570, partial [Edaphobacter sp.]|nr:hypothetical protein [Edaphobacter sp.]